MMSVIVTRSAVALLVLCMPLAAQAQTSRPSVRPAPDLAKPAAPRTVSKWRYSSSSDKMRDTVTRFARLESQNILRFGFPFSPGRATLTLRDRPEDGLNVMLSVQGQFLCNSYSGGSVAVKFDAEPIEEYGCSEPDAGTPGLLFIENEEQFVTKLLNARRVFIEASFYQRGRVQIEFAVFGLSWRLPLAPLQAAPPPSLVPPPPAPVKLEAIERTHTKAPYPALSQRMGEQGTTELMIVVGPDGVPITVEVTTSSGSQRLDNAAIEHVKARWRWVAPTQNGKPVEARTTARMVWNLQDVR